MERICITTLLLLCTLIGGCMKTQTVQFGVIADVQYADKPDAMGRSYRTSLKGLQKAADSFNASQLAFVVQLGDLIDGGDKALPELQEALATYNQIHAPKYHVLGNHDFSGLARPIVLETLQLPKAYYSFDTNGWRFVVLDTQDYATQGGWPENSPNLRQAFEMLDQARAAGAPNAQDYNGGVGLQQLVWLDSVLTEADAKDLRVILFMHLPLMPPGQAHNAWNADKIVAVLDKHPCVKACFSGHNHAGDYSIDNGIHYITLEAVVNAADRSAWAIVALSPTGIEISGFGAATSRTLPFD